MIDTAAIYAAGFFDGEGCIQLQNGWRVHRNGRRYARHSLFLSISQNDPAPLFWIKERFGGYVYESKVKASGSRPEHRRWDWKANSESAKKFLERVLPHLITKKKEAEIALEFASSFLKGNTRNGLPAEVITFRTDCAARLLQARADKKALAYGGVQ